VERRGDLIQRFDDLRLLHGYYYEAKWNRVNERSLPFITRLVECFFRARWLAFHCLVIRKADVNKALSGGNSDLAWRKAFTTVIADKCTRSAARQPDRLHTVRVWTDPIASSYRKADEAAQAIGRRMVRKRVGERCHLEYVTTHDSKGTPAIQLCDVLLGAVVTAWLQKGEGRFKAEARQWIAGHLGWPDLRGATSVGQPKFNLWYYWPRVSGPRQVWPRRVSLLYPTAPRPHLHHSPPPVPRPLYSPPEV
jgi:hypothetical protein